MKKLFVWSLLSAVTFLFVSGKYVTTQKIPLQNDSTTTVRISIVGDLMCHMPEMNFARVGKDSFDFRPMFSEVKKYLSASDLTIGNLETTIADKEKKYSGYPLFNSPDDFLSAIKYAGFNILFTANNHTLDRGTNGIIRTLDKIYGLGMNSVGTFRSEKDRDSIRIFDIRGMKIAILSYTYGLNGNYVPQKQKFMVSEIDTALIKKNIESAREKHADVVLTYFHFGTEYQRKPNEYQKKIVACAAKYGADVIIGSHPHVIEPAEIFQSSAGKLPEGLIAYSLGNFISNQRWRYSDAGVILNIEITKSKTCGETRLKEVSYIPTWVFKGNVNGKNKFVILPSDTSVAPIPKYLSKADRVKLLQSFNDTKEMFSGIQKHFPMLLNK